MSRASSWLSSTTSIRRPRDARLAAEAIPGCEYREVAGSGHIGILTHAEQVAAYLIEFFDQN